MNFEDIFNIVQDTSLTPYQKAANLHALLAGNGVKIDSPRAKPKVSTPRKARTQTALETHLNGSSNSSNLPLMNGSDHAG